MQMAFGVENRPDDGEDGLSHSRINITEQVRSIFVIQDIIAATFLE